MKQAGKNPWDDIDQKFPIGSKVKGEVKSLANYGAFVAIGGGIEGLLHVNDIGWTRNWPIRRQKWKLARS